jgi:hypothetical protein
MPASTQTRIVSPVVLAESRRTRVLRRTFALLAFAAFVAGILVASGFPELVVAAAPFVAAGGVAVGVVWALLHVRPWRVARPAGHAVAVAGRSVGGSATWAGRVTKRGAVAVPPLARTGWIAGVVFVSRPRERWRPPRPVEASIRRTRLACASALERTAPLRVRADAEWNRLAAAGVAYARRGPQALSRAYSSRDRQARARRVVRARRGRRRAG